MVPVPPVAVTVAEYACPTAAAGMLVEEKVRAGTVILMINDAVELPLVVSLTVTSRVNVPCAVGVPETVLPEAISPGGRPDMDQVGDRQAAPSQVAVNVQL